MRREDVSHGNHSIVPLFSEALPLLHQCFTDTGTFVTHGLRAMGQANHQKPIQKGSANQTSDSRFTSLSGTTTAIKGTNLRAELPNRISDKTAVRHIKHAGKKRDSDPGRRRSQLVYHPPDRNSQTATSDDSKE